ncbi:MAG: MarR family winged helix-turn-helix transcriptional regulator [Caulobacter sp.]|nr:MarR family winged helix-turn-helix transcriptional regulator [Caulobacter sp.]
MAKDKSAKRAPAIEASVGHLLHRAAQRALDFYAEEAGPGAVTQRQHAVLAAVAAREGAAQADLVAATGIDRSTLADMVARMIDKGLLARERSSLDARANAVRLTDAGRAALAETGPRAATADTRLLALLSKGQRAVILEALAALATGVAVEKKAKAVKAPKADKPPKAPKPPKVEKKKKKKTRPTEIPGGGGD